ncbi:MAG: PhoU domain-containing protein, partial [Candidatus Thermoplasmatota archaeon]|nr:PhoU domain-containing protein [Candidatus Thermoplasmatota archaeon]
MHQDAITSVITSDKELADAVISRDVEVDRLNWLIEHQYNIVSREANLVGKMGITPDEAQFYFLVSRVMERIGDHAVRIASNYTALEEGKASIYEESIRDASETALGVFNDSTSAWFQKDMVLANKAVQSVNNVTKKCRKISEVMSKERPASSIKRLPVAYVRESIRRTGEYSADIGELVINHLV